MKQFLLSLIAVTFAGAVMAQNCSELFFSEYVEGTGNNKALEIYNPTNAAISLNDYQMARYSNGSTAANYVSFPNGQTIPAHGVLVVVLDKRDPNGTGADTVVNAELMALADIFLCPVYNVNKMMYFNGNDAVTLERKSSGAFVDIFGVIGENPGPDQGWNDNEETGFWQTTWYDPNHWTQNNTMVRKGTIKKGITTNPEFFNTSIEWDTLGTDVFSNLRSHSCDCNPSGIFEVNSAQVVLYLYPNPVSNDIVTIHSNKNITKIEIYNIIGQHVFTSSLDGSMAKVQLDLNAINNGLYLAKVFFTDNTSSTRKFQVK